MTTWKDGGDCGRMSREITNENESRTICAVRVRQGVGFGYDEPWPEGEENFRLILKAPQMLAALEAIRDKAEWMMGPSHTLAIAASWQAVRDCARTAIAAVKGEGNETEMV